MNFFCPGCGYEHTRRVRRPLWMRLFKGSMAFECDRCGRRFMARMAPTRQTAQQRPPAS